MTNINHLALLILGFDESQVPTKDELAQAYRNASLKFHPDMGGSSQLFRALSMAKEIVSDLLSEDDESDESPTGYYYNKSNEEKCGRQKREIIHQAGMAAANLSKGWRRIKTITLHTDDYGVLVVNCHHMWDVKDIDLPSKFHTNYEVLKMYADALRWISSKPRRKYKSTASYDLDRETVAIKFSYEYEGIWNWILP